MVHKCSLLSKSSPTLFIPYYFDDSDSNRDSMDTTEHACIIYCAISIVCKLKDCCRCLVALSNSRHAMDYVAHQASLSMGIIQARILEWVAIFFSRGSSQPRDRTCVSCIGRRILYHWATRETRIKGYQYFKSKLTEDAHNSWKQHILVCFHPSSHLYIYIYFA